MWSRKKFNMVNIVCRIGSSNAVDTICITVEDYCQDFIHLKDQFYDALIQRMQQRIACEYYKALFTAKYATNAVYILLCVFAVFGKTHSVYCIDDTWNTYYPIKWW